MRLGKSYIKNVRIITDEESVLFGDNPNVSITKAWFRFHIVVALKQEWKMRPCLGVKNERGHDEGETIKCNQNSLYVLHEQCVSRSARVSI